VGGVRGRLVLAVMVLSVFAWLAPSAKGKFVQPTDAPVERLLKNVAAYTKEHPTDPEGFYTLGRVHFLAFTIKTGAIKTFGEGDEAGKALPRLPDDSFQRGPIRTPAGSQPAKVTPPTDKELIAHLNAAIENFRKAIAMDSKKALYHLGLACVLEQGASMAEKIGAVPRAMPATDVVLALEDQKKMDAQFEGLIKELGSDSFETREAATKKLRAALAAATPYLMKHVGDSDVEVKARVGRLLGDGWKEQAIASYLEAYKLAIAKDLEIKSQPLLGLKSLVGYEAGESYVRLVKARGEADAEKEQIAKTEDDLKALQGKPQGPVTPIIFSLQGPSRLEDLLAPDLTVKFNLDGTGRAQRWNWVKPETGILVWDLKGTGEITSGWQLFGSVSFFMFWEDGYRALDALDDNRDGKLDGDELRGLAVWFDRNSNGRADAGEVVPVEKCGIRDISARATSKSGMSPCNSAGITLQDGSVLPTYDWVAQPKR